VRLYDDLERPLALECFTNVADSQQRADLEMVALQKQLYLLFYDEQLQHRLSKRVANSRPWTILTIGSTSTKRKPTSSGKTLSSDAMEPIRQLDSTALRFLEAQATQSESPPARWSQVIQGRSAARTRTIASPAWASACLG
jgi:hypothetical protein